LHDAFDLPVATVAGTRFALAVVNAEAMLEFPKAAIGPRMIAQA
jgi:hypothetical protein